MRTEPEHPFAYYCGLLPEQFPPAERLTDDQLRVICNSFKKLLFSWSLQVEIPESMPVRTSYPFIISTLAEKVTIVICGLIGIEFCTCDPPSCPLNEHCSCIEFLEDEHEQTEIPEEHDNDAGLF